MAILKNALDVASRSFGQNAWNGKPGTIISVTPGKLGSSALTIPSQDNNCLTDKLGVFFADIILCPFCF
jgi:hypothetical protein